MEEIWKDVVGYEGFYQVSNLGRVKSIIGRKGFPAGYIAKNSVGNNGYPRVALSIYGESKFYSVHRLVATAFIPNPDSKPQVNHKNGIKTDNRVENLEWVTSQENCVHAYRTGLHIIKPISEDTRRKLSESHKGQLVSEKTRMKLSKALKGQQRSEETRKRIREAQKGKHHTEEARMKMSESHKGKHNSAEIRKKISEANKGRVYVNDGNKNRMIKPTELQDYLNMGYIQGFLKKEA